MILRTQAADIRARYYDGREFMEFLATKLPDSGIKQAFRKPPVDHEVIDHPAWFLDPELRPAKLYDFAKPLEAFVKRFDAKEWGSRKAAASAAQLRASLSILPKEQVEPLFKRMKHNKLAVVFNKKRTSRMVIAALFELDAPSGAREFLAAEIALLHEKDRRMKTGRIRVKSSKYTDLAEFDATGAIFEKVMSVDARTTPVTSVVAIQGAVLVELNYSGEEVTATAAVAMAKALLADAAVVGRQKGTPVLTPSRKQTDRPKRLAGR